MYLRRGLVILSFFLSFFHSVPRGIIFINVPRHIPRTVHMLRPNLESIQIRIRMGIGCPKPHPNLNWDGKIIKLKSHKIVTKCHNSRRP